jgi:hypothetical protein
MHSKTRTALILFLVSAFFVQNATGKVINNKRFKFSVTLPDAFIEVKDTADRVEGDLFFDTTADMVLLITKAQRKFKSVNDYIDCSRLQLENELRISYGDSTLRLLSCNKSPYYPDKTVLLNIEVSVLPQGYDQSIIYFIHHKSKDIQFSFMFKKKNATIDLKQIDAIMKTLELL